MVDFTDDELDSIDPGLQIPPPSETAKRVTRKAEEAKTQAVRSHTREQAIMIGRLLGQDAAQAANEPKQETEHRTRRAMAYAAWEYDGKPIDNWDHYKTEFGIGGNPITPSQERK